MWTGGDGSFVRSGVAVGEMGEMGAMGGEWGGWVRDVMGREWRLPVLDVVVKI